MIMQLITILFSSQICTIYTLSFTTFSRKKKENVFVKYLSKVSLVFSTKTFPMSKNLIKIPKSFIRKQLRGVRGVFLLHSQSCRGKLFVNFFMVSFKQQRCSLISKIILHFTCRMCFITRRIFRRIVFHG